MEFLVIIFLGLFKVISFILGLVVGYLAIFLPLTKRRIKKINRKDAVMVRNFKDVLESKEFDLAAEAERIQLYISQTHPLKHYKDGKSKKIIPELDQQLNFYSGIGNAIDTPLELGFHNVFFLKKGESILETIVFKYEPDAPNADSVKIYRLQLEKIESV